MLLGLSALISLGVLSAALVMALRHRGLLIWCLAGLLALIAVQSVVVAAGASLNTVVPVWLEWVGQGEIVVVLSSALSLLAIALLMSALNRQSRIEQQLAERSTVLAAAQDIAGLGHYIYDDDVDDMVYCSETFAAVYGRSQEEVQKSVSDTLQFIHPDDRESANTIFNEASDNRSDYVVDYRIIRPDGEIRFVREAGIYVEDRKGKTARSIGTLLDLTDLRKTEDALRENRAALHLAQTHAGFGHYIVDPDKEEMRHISQSLFDILGVEACDVDGLGMDYFIQFIVEEDQERTWDIYKRAIEAHTPFTMDYRVLRPSGEIIHIREVGSFQEGDKSL